MWTPADLTVSLEIILSKPAGVLYTDIILVTGVHARGTKRSIVGSGAYELIYNVNGETLAVPLIGSAYDTRVPVKRDKNSVLYKV